MTQVDFYSLQESTVQARLHFACRLTEKAWTHGMKVWLQVTDRATAEELDNLLWSFRPDSFIPHATTDTMADLEGEEVPVIIGYSEVCQVPTGLLINLGTGIPAFFDKFDRVAEIVIEQDQVKQESREHWKQFRASGIEPELHRL